MIGTEQLGLHQNLLAPSEILGGERTISRKAGLADLEEPVAVVLGRARGTGRVFVVAGLYV